MATPKSSSSGVFYARITNKKRNKSAIDIEKDLNLLNNQDQQSEELQNNPIVKEQKNQTGPLSKPNDPYKAMMANMNKDNLSYISDLLKSNQIKETRAAQRKSNHGRTKSSLSQYSSLESATSTSANVAKPGDTQQRDARETKSVQNFTDNQQSLSPTSPQSFFEEPFKNSSNKEEKSMDIILASQRPQIQQKSLSHRSLNETLPIFSRGSSCVQQPITQRNPIQQQSTPQNNNLSFQADSDPRIPPAAAAAAAASAKQSQYPLDNFTSAHETNQSTGLSVRRTEQAHFLQFLGNYVTYLSQSDENPSTLSINMFSNPGKYNSQQQQQSLPPLSTTQGMSSKHLQLINENHLLQKDIEALQCEFKELQYSQKIQFIEFNQLISIQQEDKQKIAQQSEYIENQSNKIQDLQLRLKHTQDQLAKERIEHENEQIALKKLISAMQQKLVLNYENNIQSATAGSTNKQQHSKNSFSLNSFNHFVQKNDFSHDATAYEEYEQPAGPFFSSKSYHHPPMMPSHQARGKSSQNSSKSAHPSAMATSHKSHQQKHHPFSKSDLQMNGSSNFISQDNSMMFESGLNSLNNTGIFNFQGHQHHHLHHTIDEEGLIDKSSDNMSKGMFLQATDRLTNEDAAFDAYQQDAASPRLEYSGNQAQRKQSFASYKAQMMQQAQKQQQQQHHHQFIQQTLRAKQQSQIHNRNSPSLSLDRPDQNQSYYQSYSPNLHQNEIGKPLTNLKERGTPLHLQDQQIYQQQYNLLHNQQLQMQGSKSNKSSVNVSVNNCSMISSKNNSNNHNILYGNNMLNEIYQEELNTSSRHANGLSLLHLE